MSSVLTRRLSPEAQRRICCSVLLAAVVGFVSGYVRLFHSAQPSDLGLLLDAGQALLAGEDPYAVVRKSRFGLLYPFPAVLLFTPFARMSPWLVDALWCGVSAGLLFWALTRERPWPPALALFVSLPFIFAVRTSQWSVLLTAAALMPWAGWLFACKPTTALWLVAYAPNRRNLAMAAGAVAVSLAVWPSWPWAWFGVLGSAAYTFAPLTLTPAGPVVLLALLKWRRPEARLLAVMACVPHTTLGYEQLPLFLVAQTWTQAGVIWLGTTFVAGLVPGPLSPANVAAHGAWSVWFVYLPCLFFILRRPNEGDLALPPRLLALLRGANPLAVSARADTAQPTV